MVGKVKNVQELIKIKKNDVEKSLFKFEISNGSSTVPVTFFDEFGKLVEKQFGGLDAKNLYVIISCAKVGRYEGTSHLSNYPATRVFVNPKHYSVAELKRSWTEKKKEPVKPYVEQEKVVVHIPRKISTVKEIKNLPANHGEGNVFCEVTVKRISDPKNWFFRKCSGCNLELEHEGGKFKCSRANGCGRIIPYPEKRFRLCTLCSDERGSIAIIFPDHEITKIIDKTVIDLHADCADEAEEDKFPEILDTFLKKKRSTSASTRIIYRRARLFMMHRKFFLDRKKGITLIQLDNSTDGNGNQTPQTGNSTNMKTKARKGIEPVAFSTADNSMPPPLKNIKVEKIGK
ncbi:hypothetical protein DCAR_0830839 [Daucus carota subsp. sativus]|uniref:Uncharacterized protein n=1 Tax=Daucus carota subsp. sativus TaxID=79200 RepID=A0A175YK62_DAUCS|nr:hypothetical protein DCAR_0830839 [Daucus carota subsp. sativus]